MIQKEIKKFEITKSRYEWMLDCNDQFNTGYKFYVSGDRYFNITNLDKDRLLDFINSVSKVPATKKKTYTHTVKHPFYSRMGQFEEGKQSLSVGIDVHSLFGCDVRKLYLGNNKSVYYRIKSSEAIRLAEGYGSIWINPAGRKVAILPLKDFIKVERKKKIIN